MGQPKFHTNEWLFETDVFTIDINHTYPPLAMKSWASVLAVVAALGAAMSSAASLALPGTWGMESIRTGAHMFWWMIPTTRTDKPSTDIPLVLWLQVRAARPVAPAVPPALVGHHPHFAARIS